MTLTAGTARVVPWACSATAGACPSRPMTRHQNRHTALEEFWRTPPHRSPHPNVYPRRSALRWHFVPADDHVSTAFPTTRAPTRRHSAGVPDHALGDVGTMLGARLSASLVLSELRTDGRRPRPTKTVNFSHPADLVRPLLFV